jgi:hypothetical protein
MKRIVIHWSAGTYTVSHIDKEHYHKIIDKDGKVHNGDHKPEANLSISDGIYAAHTRGANAGAIGVAVAAMADARGPGALGKYPITKQQFGGLIAEVKRLTKAYKIPVTPSTVLTHAEVEKTLGIQQRGKIDIAFGIPGQPGLRTAKACGDYIRSLVR